jgi:hypothetical protein
VTRFGEAFTWMFRDPAWRFRFLVQGLILLVPVVGLIALAGWMLACMDNVRDERFELAPNGFYIERGIQLFAVALIYFLVLSIPYAVLNEASALAPANGALYGLAQLANAFGLLAFALLLPAMLVETDEGGFLAGIDPRHLLRSSLARVSVTLVAALAMVVAELIAFAGVFVFLVGVLFTTLYAATAMVAVAVWWADRAYGHVAFTGR